MDRLQLVLNERYSVTENIKNNLNDPSPTPFESSLVEDIYQQDDSIGEQNLNTYIYYVASRIHRNLRSEQGKLLDFLLSSIK